MASLADWLEPQYRHSGACLMRSISCEVVKARSGFGQTVRPAKGSIVASPVPAAYDPDPDYFFHWYRDSAVVADALRLLSQDSSPGLQLLPHFMDFVRFSTSLYDLKGEPLVESSWRDHVAGPYRQYLRSSGELTKISGEMTAGETRVNPDGTLDISKWARPQWDGVALRALTLLRWLRTHAFGAAERASIETLLRRDLAVTRAHCGDVCFDIWEEERGRHYYTLRVAAAALAGGARWLEERSDPGGRDLAAQSVAILRELDDYWIASEGFLSSRVLESGVRSAKELDIAVILAAIHADDGEGGPHTVSDARMQATLTRLEHLFGAAYPINRTLPDGCAPAMGRYAGDVYFSGGAYYFSSLGAAEFCFKAALCANPSATSSAGSPAAWRERGDAHLRTVRHYTPASGDLAEQFDQTTGDPRSAKHLAWSYAAFISCVDARRRAFAAVQG